MARANAFIMSSSYRVDKEEKQTYVNLYAKTEKCNLIKIEEPFDPFCYVEATTDKVKRDLTELENKWGERIVKAVTVVNLKNQQHTYVNMFKVNTIRPTDIYEVKRYCNYKGINMFSGDIMYPLRYIFTKDIGAFIDVSGEYDVKTGTLTKPKYNATNKQFEPVIKTMVMDL